MILIEGGTQAEIHFDAQRRHVRVAFDVHRACRRFPWRRRPNRSLSPSARRFDAPRRSSFPEISGAIRGPRQPGWGFPPWRARPRLPGQNRRPSARLALTLVVAHAARQPSSAPYRRGGESTGKVRRDRNRPTPPGRRSWRVPTGRCPSSRRRVAMRDYATEASPGLPGGSPLRNDGRAPRRLLRRPDGFDQ